MAKGKKRWKAGTTTGRKPKALERVLDFAWWNAQDFAHYFSDRRAETRWPSKNKLYKEKCRRIDQAVCEAICPQGSLDNLADPVLHVAVIYDPGMGFVERSPIALPAATRGTRAMAVMDLVLKKHEIRFIACHWTAFDDVNSRILRDKTADYLMGEIYTFLHGSDEGKEHHVVVMGDLNTEPFDMLEFRFCGSRSRSRATDPEHYTDRDVRRVRLYNCAWRFMGESRPFPTSTDVVSVVGTYYNRKEKQWRTVDHILVSGGLVQSGKPHLVEDQVGVVAHTCLVDNTGHPQKFEWDGAAPGAVSDHLPIRGRILLPEN